MEQPHFDVIIVGAGLSGIGMAHQLRREHPNKTLAILEGRAAIGGTWDLFRYPGIRSDSDMHTLGYSFRPWSEAQAIADGPAIRSYIRETAEAEGIVRHIRFRQQVKRASWSSEEARWTVEVEDGESGQLRRYSCGFLCMCSGYYSYKQGYTPKFPGIERFTGTIVHPQQWPEDLDYRDKQVVVIGSGATAVTLVPAMAEQAAHVVMLQRTPTWISSKPGVDAVAKLLARFLPESIVYGLVRRKNIAIGQLFYRLTRVRPDLARKLLLRGLRSELGDSYDIATHFTPSYDPWDQRLCLVPDGDLFAAIRSGSVSVVTDHIETFTERGVALRSGRELAADLIVTATGLQLVVLGEVDFEVDGQAVDFSRCYTYKGTMFSDVPNLAYVFGYINASWTLRAELIAAHASRVLAHMDRVGATRCVPRIPAANMRPAPFLDFDAGYVKRSADVLPKQGDVAPWITPQDYELDRELLLRAPLDDGALEFSAPQRQRHGRESGGAAAAS